MLPSSAAVSQEPNLLAPVAPDERIHALDVLRGWAMFGVLWSNLNDWYGAPAPVTATGRFLLWLQDNLMETRFYTLLCLLFGIGFGIQALRAANRGVDVRTVYYRRALALLAIGIVHGCLVWNGDILTIYALVAFALVMFRKVGARRVLVSAAVLWFVVPEIVSRAKFVAGMRFWKPWPWNPTTDWLFAHGTWGQIERIRVAGYLDWFGRFGLAYYFSILATFLMGLWALKSGYLRRVIDDPRTTRRLLVGAIIAATIGYASNAYAARLWPPLKVPVAGFTDPYFWYPRRFVLHFLDWSVEGTAVAYAAVLLLLWQRPRIARALRPLATTGRMALTTYLTQSVVCTSLFYGYGLKWYGRVGHTGMLLILVILFGCQMAASTWWLARFRFGPVEWLWRTASYGRAPKMRITTAHLPA
jgi:uncharacterized protein